ncbi:MAG TPA: FAD-dependent oxidoreductase [Ktedonobacteraceae bacterium]|nr:FAD-dependent oxidoreductase [Ktedonobacteraceae bacterium]
MSEVYELAIVGAGLSALSAIADGLGRERTIVLDYQEEAGGFLRHALPAPGFEVPWELMRSTRLPQTIRACFSATVVGLLPAFEADEPHMLVVRQKQGTSEIQAKRVLIACGGLEITREHAQVPGSRPAGVMTPIMAHQLLAQGYLPGKRAIVYGDARYTRATAQRLASAGVDVSLITPSEAKLIAIEGSPRLQRVALSRAGETYSVEADMLVFGVGMMANTHWLKGSGIDTAPDGRVLVDADYQTNVACIYAVGTVIAPSLDHIDSLAMGKEVASLLLGGIL